jgi:1,2-phenylacetyl-CoA epoxidase catalytic subunit
MSVEIINILWYLAFAFIVGMFTGAGISSAESDNKYKTLKTYHDKLQDEYHDLVKEILKKQGVIISNV